MSSTSNPPHVPTPPTDPRPHSPPHFVDGTAPSPDLEANTPSPTTQRPNPLFPGFHNPPPFLTFLRHNWPDIATQLLCLLTALLLYSFCPPILPRYFPLYPGVEKSAWGMKHSQPYLAEYVNTIVSAVVSFVVPAAVMGGIALWGTRSFKDGNAAVSLHLPFLLPSSTSWVLPWVWRLTKVVDRPRLRPQHRNALPIVS